MFNQFFCRYPDRIKQLGTIAMVLGALFAPVVPHAHGSKAHASTQQAETEESKSEHGESGQGESEHGESEHGNTDKAEKSHGKMDHGASAGHGHGSKLVDVSEWESVPALSVEVEKDPMSGWNIRLKPHNFQFTPENINKDNQIGEGHAHLYVDDEKVARVYGSWFHLPELPVGQHSIKVTLNANDHSTLAVVDNPIENMTIIEQE